MHKVGEIDKEFFEKYFGKLKTNEVIITDERIAHIKENHPKDYGLFEKYVSICISSPDRIITDERNEATVYMIKKVDDGNLNVVLKLMLEKGNSDFKNFIITFWKIRDKNVKKLEKKNKILYKKE